MSTHDQELKNAADSGRHAGIKKVEVRPNTLLHPVPALLVSSGTADGRTNIMTAG